eukprot:2435881-Amphidinium_carterae.1
MGVALTRHSPCGQWGLHEDVVFGLVADPLLGGARSFVIATVNTTSIYSYAADLLDFPASLIAVQETKLCQGDIAILSSLQSKWQLFHPVLPLGTGDRHTRSGGVLLMADHSWQVQVLPTPQLLAEDHNCLVFMAQHRSSSYRLVGA